MKTRLTVEGESSQRHTAGSRMNMASKIDQAMRGSGGGGSRQRDKRGPGVCVATLAGFYRNQKLGEGKQSWGWGGVGWRSLG